MLLYPDSARRTGVDQALPCELVSAMCGHGWPPRACASELLSQHSLVERNVVSDDWGCGQQSLQGGSDPCELRLTQQHGIRDPVHALRRSHGPTWVDQCVDGVQFRPGSPVDEHRRNFDDSVLCTEARRFDVDDDEVILLKLDH